MQSITVKHYKQTILLQESCDTKPTWFRIVYLFPAQYRISPVFVVVEFEKSVNEMGLLDMPTIKSWWWDVPEELNKVDTQFNAVSMTVPDDQILKRYDQYLAA